MSERRKYVVSFCQDVRKWGVYSGTSGDEWTCDCVDKGTAIRICRLLNKAEGPVRNHRMKSKTPTPEVQNEGIPN